MTRQTLPILATIISGLLVGANIVASRFVIAQASPAQLAFMRYTRGFVFLLDRVGMHSYGLWFATR